MSTNPNYKTATSIHEFTVKNIKGEDVKLDVYKGHVCIILNVASRCGLAANNYKQLNQMYEAYAEEKGLRILAFPCNQFAGQEPGNPEEIVCSISERRVKFDLFEKIKVNGNDASPLWKFLKYKKGGTLCGFIKWNFTKFIIDKDGVPVERHGPKVDPLDLVKSLEKYCRAKNVHEFSVESLKGEAVKLDKYKDFVCVIVNIGTKSPLTARHYKVFNELMDKFGDKLRILAFPCNQFGQEEPGTSEDIAAHAEQNNVKFDIFAKVEVNGDQASVLWKYLKA